MSLSQFYFWLLIKFKHFLIFKHFIFVANVSSYNQQGFIQGNVKGSFCKDPKYSFLGFTNLLIAISTLKIGKFLPQKKVVYDFLKTKFSILHFTKTEVPNLPKEKSSWKIALWQKALWKKSPEKYPLLHFDSIEINQVLKSALFLFILSKRIN